MAIRNAWSFDLFPGPMSEDDSESFCSSLDCAGVNDEKVQSDSFVFSFRGDFDWLFGQNFAKFNRVNQKWYAIPWTDIVAHNVPFNARRVFFDTPRVTPLLLVECDVLWDMFFLGDFCQSFRSCNHSDKACYALQLESLYQVH